MASDVENHSIIRDQNFVAPSFADVLREFEEGQVFVRYVAENGSLGKLKPNFSALINVVVIGIIEIRG
ncbi:hypothetical protein TON_1127 [Thermococcus onnurineus NA1]|uniref:Uncharacterized protein n=1 Tax=Thermococcus onnurineus (strain NA1) TaxID=523850 RepID=B6YX02_THEON|nr:hypothetical protein TON_1127 [Thermococcus onnurineus NA1]